MPELTAMPRTPNPITGGELIPGLQSGTSAGLLLAQLASAPRGAVLFARAAYLADTGSTADADPGAGNLRWNDASPDGATEVYLADEDLDSNDRAALWSGVDPGGRLYVQRVDATGIVAEQAWAITAVDALGGYVRFGLSLVAAHGTFAGSDTLQVSLQARSAGAVDADEVNYNNTASGLAADDVQAALDEIVGMIPGGGASHNRPIIITGASTRFPSAADAGYYTVFNGSGAKTCTFNVAEGYDAAQEFWYRNNGPDGDLTIVLTGITVAPAGADLVLKPGETAMLKFTAADEADWVRFDGGGTERNTTTALTSGSTITIDLSLGDFFTVTLAHNATIAFSNPPGSGKGFSVRLKVTQDGTGSHTLAQPAEVKLTEGSDPAIKSAASAVTLIHYTSDDNGTVIDGTIKGRGA